MEVLLLEIRFVEVFHFPDKYLRNLNFGSKTSIIRIAFFHESRMLSLLLPLLLLMQTTKSSRNHRKL